MGADFRAFLEHADRAVRRELLDADGAGEPRGTAADDDHVVLHGFARHAANYNQPFMNEGQKLVHFRYMEQARIGWFDALVPDGQAWKGTGIVVANASCNFRRAIGYPGTVEVKIYAGKPGGSSVGTYYELRVDNDAEPYADGAAVVVFIDMQKQKPIRIPEAIRGLLKEGIK